MLVALVPAVAVLWFMSVAMRNERLAVQERLAGVYQNYLTSAQRQLTAFSQARQTALQTVGAATAGEKFATFIRSNLADSVVLYDAGGKLRYPTTANVEEPADENTIRARALQAKAAERLQSGQKELALATLTELVGDRRLRNAISATGALIVPNVQWLIVKLLGESEVGASLRDVRPGESGRLGDVSLPREIAQQTLADLMMRLNDYTDLALPSAQRRFLMHELGALAPGVVVFPTLEAEDLAAAYLEHDPIPATDAKLHLTTLPRVWRLASADGSVIALFREERLRSDLAKTVGELALPDARVAVLAPGEAPAADNRLPLLEAGELLPGWRLALSFTGADPLAAASERQSRLYLWIGFLVVLIVAVLALMVARFVSAQMRLARLKNELVSTVSHELKTPLASMRALVDTLAAGRFRDEQQLREYLQLIAKENVRLSHLIENFLAFSRMERGQQRFEFEALSPVKVMHDAVDVLKEKLGSPLCRFELEAPAGLPLIRGDAEALGTVLINLLDNACKYTNGDKRIALRARADGRDVWFEVEDNGIGLALEEIEKIFDRFYQVDQSLTRQRGGCGLGLSIVKSIVEAHHGTVDVKSEPGNGSIFRVGIPQLSPDTSLTQQR